MKALARVEERARSRVLAVLNGEESSEKVSLLPIAVTQSELPESRLLPVLTSELNLLYSQQVRLQRLRDKVAFVTGELRGQLAEIHQLDTEAEDLERFADEVIVIQNAMLFRVDRMAAEILTAEQKELIPAALAHISKAPAKASGDDVPAKSTTPEQSAFLAMKLETELEFQDLSDDQKTALLNVAQWYVPCVTELTRQRKSLERKKSAKPEETNHRNSSVNEEAVKRSEKSAKASEEKDGLDGGEESRGATSNEDYELGIQALLRVEGRAKDRALKLLKSQLAFEKSTQSTEAADLPELPGSNVLPAIRAEVDLSASQTKRMQPIYDRLAYMTGELQKQLMENFTGDVEAEESERLAGEIVAIQKRMLWRVDRMAVKILTPEQKEAIPEAIALLAKPRPQADKSEDPDVSVPTPAKKQEAK